MGYSDNGRCIERTLLIDADDTLWENNIFYLRCTARFQDFMVGLGCAPDTATHTLSCCEQEVVPAMGYGPAAYVAALGMACERLLCSSGRGAQLDLIAKARSFGEPVLSPPMHLIADVELTLQALRPTSQLVLVTKGLPNVQRDKLERSGLASLFDRCYVVAEKDAATYRAIAAELQLNPRDTWMVGNSPKSDINPAIEVGLGAILVLHNHTWTAEVEEIARPDLVVTLQRFADLAPFFGVEVLA